MQELASLLIDGDFAFLILVEVVDARCQFLLLLLEDMELVQNVGHCGYEEDESTDSPDIGMRSFIIFEHNKALTVTHLVPLKDFGVVFRELRLLLLNFLLVDVVLLSISLVVLLHFLIVHVCFFLFVESVVIDIQAEES